MVDTTQNNQAGVNGAPTRPTLPPIETANARGLTPLERTVLTFVINAVRAGTHTVWARVRYDKQTDTEPRVDGVDYLADDEDGKGHLVRIVGAPTSRENEVYLKTQDYSRADGEKPWAWTNFKLSGLKSFELRGREAGPFFSGA